MRFRTSLVTALAVAGLAFAPAKAHASAPCPVAGYQLGLGGYLTGCWGQLTVSRLYEYAYDISAMYWFSNPATAAALPSQSGGAYNTDTNAPGIDFGVNLLFNDNCGSNGVNDGGVFCTANTQVLTWNNPEELVFGLDNTAAQGIGVWAYTGTNLARNANPPPGGMQAVLLQVTGINDGKSHFLLGWEDRNTGCFSNTGNTTIDVSQLTQPILAGVLNTCTSLNPGNQSDHDYNDFYVLLDADVLGIPTDTVPEPMTMTLLATGLVGLGGASFRKRNKKS